MSGLIARWARLSSLAASAGASLIGFIQSGVGAVLRTLQAKARDVVSVKDFGAVGDGVADDTAAIQAAMNYCSTSNGQVPALYLPAGLYKISAPLVPPGYFIHMYGAGGSNSVLVFDGVSACIKSPILQYFRPYFHDFGISGNAASGIGIDLSPTTNQVYNGQFERLIITAGQEAIYAPRLFSFSFSDLVGSSINSHVFKVSCGPSVSWRNCYAVSAGAGKAGYRLKGCIRMYSCNGVDSADYWGIFGNAIAGPFDDFGNTDYPDIELHGCNVEAFGVTGIYTVNSVQRFVMHGGTIDRYSLSSAYHSFVRFSGNHLSGGLHEFHGTRCFVGAGAYTSYLYSDASNFVLDVGGTTGFTSIYSGLDAVSYPVLISQKKLTDGYSSMCEYHSNLWADRITAKMLRIGELFYGTTGAVDVAVTGYDGVYFNGNATTTVNRLTWADGGTVANISGVRNGRLLVKAMHTAGTLTLKHGTAAKGGMKLLGGVDLVLAKGDVAEFVHSYLYDGVNEGWVQVGPSRSFVGNFVCAANTLTTVNDARVLAASKVVLTPTNAAAAALMAGGASLYVSAKTAGVSFGVTTGDGTAAAGTEAFDYVIIN